MTELRSNFEPIKQECGRCGCNYYAAFHGICELCANELNDKAETGQLHEDWYRQLS